MMKTPNEQLLRSLLYVLHRGLSDVRYISRAGRTEQAFDLADALENVPGYIIDWTDDKLPLVVEQLRKYQEKYNEMSWFDYTKYLSEGEAPESF
jgi:hypothetical protein